MADLIIDYTAGNVVSLILDASTEQAQIVITNVPPAGTPVEMIFFVTGTDGVSAGFLWPAAVDWASALPPLPVSGEKQMYRLFTITGGVYWVGEVVKPNPFV